MFWSREFYLANDGRGDEVVILFREFNAGCSMPAN